MLTLLKREVGFALGQPALLASAAVHAAVLSWFVLTWGDGVGVPNLLPLSFQGQLARVDTVLLLALLPWTAIRCLPPERGNDLVLLTLVAGVPPSRLMVFRAAALFIAGLLLVLSGLPTIRLASAMDALGPGAVARGAALPVALAAAAAGLAVWIGHIVRTPVLAWGLTTACLVLAMAFSSILQHGSVATVALALFGLAVTLAHARRSDRTHRFLLEEQVH